MLLWIYYHLEPCIMSGGMFLTFSMFLCRLYRADLTEGCLKRDNSLMMFGWSSWMLGAQLTNLDITEITGRFAAYWSSDNKGMYCFIEISYLGWAYETIALPLRTLMRVRFLQFFSWSIPEGNLVLNSSHIHREDQINAKVFLEITPLKINMSPKKGPFQ